VGVLNTAVDFSVFMLLNKMMLIHYSYCQIAGYSAGVLNSFVWNKCWTFKNGDITQKIFSEFGKFLIINGLSLFITLISLMFLIDFLHTPTIPAKLVVLIVSQLINYLGYKFLVFRKKSK